MKAKRTVSTMELHEQDISLMKGTLYDIPNEKGGELFRSLEDWYITGTNGSADSATATGNNPLSQTIRYNIETVKRGEGYQLRGKLVSPQPEKYDAIPVRIAFRGEWAMDRNSDLRGIWARSERSAWYWLKKPCTLRHSCQVHVSVQGTRDHSDSPCTACLPSQEDLHLEVRAKFGLVSNLCDAFLFDENNITRDSLALLKRHANQKPVTLYEELKPTPELLERFPDRPTEPFDLELLKRYANFVRIHFSDFHSKMPVRCNFLDHLEQTSHREFTREELLASALAAEKRGGRHSWGELVQNNNQNDHDDYRSARIDPNWVYAARLDDAATTVVKRKRTSQAMSHDDDEEEEEEEAATTTTSKRTLFNKKRTENDAHDMDSMEESPRKAKKRTDLPSPINTTSPRLKKMKHGSDSTEISRKKANDDAISSSSKSHKMDEKQTGLPRSRLRKQAIIDDDDDDDDNIFGESDAAEMNAVELQEQDERRSNLLSVITFESQRMKDALNDMQPYLKDVQFGESPCSTLSEVRNSIYTFQSNDTLEEFLVAKMRKDFLIQCSWEYKVLVACAITGTYTDLEASTQGDPAKAKKSFEKVLFGKGKNKDQIPGVKIFCELWRKEAIDFAGKVVPSTTSQDTDEKEKRSLRESLITELLHEFCVFATKCTVLKSKDALDKVKENYGVDFVGGLTQTNDLASQLRHGKLSMACQTALNRFRVITEGGSHEKPVKERTKETPGSATLPIDTDVTPPTTQVDDYKRKGRVLRLKQLLAAKSATTAAIVDPVRNELRAPRRAASAYVWGAPPAWGSTPWGYRKDSDEGPAVSDDDPLIDWKSSTTRKWYSVWGNLGESNNELTPLIQNNQVVTVSPDSRETVTPPAEPARLPPPPSDFVPSRQIDDNRGRGRGRGTHMNRPAWQTSSGDSLGLGRRLVTAPNEPPHYQPAQSDRGSSVFGTESDLTRPVPPYPPTVFNDGASFPPDQSHHQDQSAGVIGLRRVDPASGRGRGRARTTPAWLAKQQQDQLNLNP